MNAGQMFMSMVQGVTQPVTPDTPLAAHPLAGEHNKTAAVFADLLNEISMQTNAKTFAGSDIVGIATLSNGAELPSEYSDSNNSSDVSEVSGAETDRHSDAGGISISLDVSAAGTQVILAAYAQPGRMPVVDSLPSHEVDRVQNVPIAAEAGQRFFTTEAPVMGLFADQPRPSSQSSVVQNANPVTTGHQTGRVETAPIIPTPDKPVLQTDEQSYSFAAEKPERQLQQQTKTSAATDQATQPTPQTTAKKAAAEFLQSQIAATPVMENAAKPEAAQQLPGRMPVVNSPASQQTGRVETAPISTPDKPVLKTAEQSYSFATVGPEHQLPHQPKVSAATTQATQPTPQVTANAVAPESVQPQTKSAPEMEVAARVTTTQQPPGRMPVVNSPPSHEVDSTRNRVLTTVDAESPHALPAAKVAAQPVSEQAVHPVPASRQTGRVETAPISTPDKPILQTAEQSYSFATVGPEHQLPRQTELILSVDRPHPEAPVQDLTGTQQLPGRIPVVNSPPSHEVDSTIKNVVTTVAAELPHALSAAQVSAQPVSEQAVRPVPASQQTGQLETAPVSTPDKPLLQTAEQAESLSIVLPKLQSSHRSTTAPPEPEAEIEFSLPRPLVVSKAHSTESSRMLQTTAILRPQIISLDMDQPQNSPAEFVTVSAPKLETLSPPTTHRQENGRTPEATLTLSPEIGLTQKVRPEVAMAETTAETLVKPSEETNQLNSISGIKSAPMQQAIRRVAVQVERDTNNENARTSFSQAVAKENATPQQNAVPAGEALLTSDDSMGNSGDQSWSGQRSDIQVTANQVHAQSKFEHQSAGTVPNARINAEQTRQDLPEQVAHQVRERLIQHEVKPGSQQITLTLSPENMGELKMNLNLQGQRLSVEIVAESRTVRDAILQHSDSLKDSLSRQNITVESFDVTSNGRGSGNPAQNQDAWRELARQKQQQLWASSGGYRLPQMDASPNMLAYQAKNEHAMLDIHY